MDEDKSRPAAAGPVQGAVRHLGEPLFLLHCGAVHGGEMDDWDVEANSGRAVDELTAQHPGKDLHLYALTPEEVAEVNKLRAALAQANSRAERFERGWYLRGDALEAIKAWQDSYPHATSGLTTILDQGLNA